MWDYRFEAKDLKGVILGIQRIQINVSRCKRNSQNIPIHVSIVVLPEIEFKSHNINMNNKSSKGCFYFS